MARLVKLLPVNPCHYHHHHYHKFYYCHHHYLDVALGLGGVAVHSRVEDELLDVADCVEGGEHEEERDAQRDDIEELHLLDLHLVLADTDRVGELDYSADAPEGHERRRLC